MTKQSSYQKLKKKNEGLLQDIYNLVCRGDYPEGVATKFRYNTMFRHEMDVVSFMENNPTLEGPFKPVDDILSAPSEKE